MAAKGSKPEKPACAGFPIMLEVRPTGIASHRDTYFIENGGIITSMKKLLFIIPPVLLLLAAGTLVLCKHHAERTGLACMDIDL